MSVSYTHLDVYKRQLLWLVAGETDLKRDPAQARLWWQRLLAMYMAWACLLYTSRCV